MKRLMIFVLAFVLTAALLLNMGCVSVQDQSRELLMMWQIEKQLAEEPVPFQRGWTLADKDGYRWEYRARKRGKAIEVVAICKYSFVKMWGQEKWIGTYYGTPTSWGDREPVKNGKLNGLAGCVAWAESHMNGDYFI